MKSLHLATTIVLAVAVAILSAVLILRNSESSATKTEAIGQTGLSRRIERLPEFEGAMKKLGYQTWGYRWYGGMIDATIRVGSGDKPSIAYDGKSKLSGLHEFATGLNQPAAALNSVTGFVLVVMGPIPDDKRTTNVPCRILIESSLPSGQKETTVYNELVDFAAPQSDDDSGVSVASKWLETEERNGFRELSTDPESGYRLLELRWLPENDPLETQKQAVNPSGG